MNSQANFDIHSLRQALGNFATGVTVVTACTKEGQKAGVTANSFNSVSLDPPLILWSLRKESISTNIFSKASHFAVNVLAADQIHLSNHFASTDKNKFNNIQCQLGAGNAPLLRDCIASFECETYKRLDGGDHWIFLGKVISFQQTNQAPLLYYQGTYCGVMPHTIEESKEEDGQEATLEAEDNYYSLMLQAVKHYQNRYENHQHATGLTTVEANILLHLREQPKLNHKQLEAHLGIPNLHFLEDINLLQQKSLIKISKRMIYLTKKGEKQADELRQITVAQQKEVFAKFTPKEMTIFKKILLSIE